MLYKSNHTLMAENPVIDYLPGRQAMSVHIIPRPFSLHLHQLQLIFQWEPWVHRMMLGSGWVLGRWPSGGGTSIGSSKRDIARVGIAKTKKYVSC